MGTWRIEPNAVGGWDVIAGSSGEPAFRASGRTAAEKWARSSAAPGDELVIAGPSGETLSRFAQPAPRLHGAGARAPLPGPAQPDRSSVASTTTPAGGSFGKRLDREGKQWDTLLEWALPVAAAAGSGLVSPEVADAGGSWFFVFLATLTWSLGLAFATYAVVAHKLDGYDAAGAVVVSLFAALLIANLLSVGVLDVWPALQDTGGHPLIRIPASFLIAAFQTYGVVGAVLSGSIGIWLGFRFASRFPG